MVCITVHPSNRVSSAHRLYLDSDEVPKYSKSQFVHIQPSSINMKQDAIVQIFFEDKSKPAISGYVYVSQGLFKISVKLSFSVDDIPDYLCILAGYENKFCMIEHIFGRIEQAKYNLANCYVDVFVLTKQ